MVSLPPPDGILSSPGSVPPSAAKEPVGTSIASVHSSAVADVTWETCSLRKWLNGPFLNAAFSTEEQAQIQSTIVSADKNPKYSTNPGNATTDKVFLLSINEVEKYFSSDEDRKCVPTEYAIAQGAAWTPDSYTCCWWLRSPGEYQSDAAGVISVGSVYYSGVRVDDDAGCVRPALWIDFLVDFFR